MSYILDALKKSEQEHKKGQVPGLGTVQGLPGPGGRFETDRLIWMYGLATILMAALAVGAWLFLREPAPAPEAAPPVVTAQPPADSQAVAPPTARPPAPAQAEPKPARTPSRPKATTQTTPQPPAAGTESPQLAKAAATEAATPSSPAAPTPMLEKTPPPVRIEESAPERPSAREDGNEESEAQVKPELLPVVPIEELPAETLAEMPPLKIGLHLFSDTPGARRASINGRLMREGQQVDKDLVLVEITRQGALLSFRGRRFTMPVFPR